MEVHRCGSGGWDVGQVHRARLYVHHLRHLLGYLGGNHITHLGVDGLRHLVEYLGLHNVAQHGVYLLSDFRRNVGGHQLALVGVHRLLYHLRDVGQVHRAALHVYLHLLQSRYFLLCGCGLVLGCVVCLQVALLLGLSHFCSGGGQLLVGVLQVAGYLIQGLLVFGGGFGLGGKSLVFGGSFVLGLAQTVAVVDVSCVANGLPSLLGGLHLLLLGLGTCDGSSLQLHCGLLQCLLVVLLGLGERFLSTLLWGLMCGGGCGGGAAKSFDVGLHLVYLFQQILALVGVASGNGLLALGLQVLQLLG